VQDAVQRSAGFGGGALDLSVQANSRIRCEGDQFFHFADAKIVSARHFFSWCAAAGIDLTKKTAITGGFLGNSVLSFYERLPLFTAVGLE
jgi:hypothetical protein